MGKDSWTDIVARANAAASQPVLFIPWPGRPEAWDGWVEVFKTAGYAALAPPWPSDSVPRSDLIAPLTRRSSQAAQALNSRPAIVGHGLGGMIAQVLAGEGVSAAAVAIAPSPLPDAAAAPSHASMVRRVPLMIMAGDQDEIVAMPSARAAFERQRRESNAVSEFTVFAGRGHTLTTDPGWPEVAEAALRFVQRFV